MTKTPVSYLDKYPSCIYDLRNRERITEMKKYLLKLSIFLTIYGSIFLSGQFLIGGQTDNDIYAREEIQFESAHFKIVGDLHIPDPGK